jgi:hypothetical protein
MAHCHSAAFGQQDHAAPGMCLECGRAKIHTLFTAHIAM